MQKSDHKCNTCNKFYSSINSLRNHKKKCHEVKDSEYYGTITKIKIIEDELKSAKELLVLKDNEIESLRIRNIELEKEVAVLTALSKNNRTLYEESKDQSKVREEKYIGIINKALEKTTNNNIMTNNIKYIVKNILPKQEFVALSCDKLKNMIKEQKDHVEIIANWYTNKLLEKRLGSMIVEFYKKSNPEDQALFATDITRFNYLIAEVDGDVDELKWKTDKGGIKVDKLAIKPILCLLLGTLKNWRDNYDAFYKEEIKADEYLEPVNNIIASIESGKLTKAIMKIISPQFACNKK